MKLMMMMIMTIPSIVVAIAHANVVNVNNDGGVGEDVDVGENGLGDQGFGENVVGVGVGDVSVGERSVGEGVGRRESVSFNFAWRHSWVVAPPAPPPKMGPQTCPPAWPANKSGFQCDGLEQDATAGTAQLCAAHCCEDQACAVWQFSNISIGGGCWRGTCTAPMNKNANWVGGLRNASDSPPLPPPPPPAPSDHPPEASPTFNDSSWEAVDVPHDMIIAQAPDKILCPSGCSGRSYLPRHNGWYRKHFNVPADWEDSVVSLYFEGVFRTTLLYLNGVMIGNHSCGYTSFSVRLDNNGLLFDKENVLVVYTDAMSGSGWWYEGGGIYRNVHLVKTGTLHFGNNGTNAEIFAKPALLQNGSGLVSITAMVVNDGSSATTSCMSFSLFDADTIVASTSIVGPTLAQGMKENANASLLIANPLLWKIRTPHLYTVRVSLGSCGSLIAPTSISDDVNVTVGFRSLEYTANGGFFMNGDHIKVRGYCDHNNFGAVGMAVPDRVNLFRAEASRSVGGNGRRTSHNPPNPGMLDIYDRIGIVVMDENREFFDGDQYVDNMADLVRRDRNHPSVTIWSFCNEGACMASNGADFRQITYEYDGTRPVLGNHNGNPQLNKNMDVQGFSHQSRNTLAAYHKQFPQKPEFSSECCSCNTQRGEDHSQENIESSFNGPCIAQQTNWSNGVDFVVGSMVWTLFDYFGEPSFGGWPHVSSTFGSFDLAGFAKPAVWWYKSWWLNDVPDSSPDKTFTTGDNHHVHIVQSWDADPPVPPSNQSFASTCDSNSPYQKISFLAGNIRWGDLCLNPSCANASVGCAPLPFTPCSSDISLQWNYTGMSFHSITDPLACLDLWGSGNGPQVGLYNCDGGKNQKWTVDSSTNMVKSSATNPSGRCLSNGQYSAQRVVNVYSDLHSVELFVNGESTGPAQPLFNPGISAPAGFASWGTFPVSFRPGNITAVGYDNKNDSKAVHTVFSSGQAAAIILSIDAPSPTTGTGNKLLLDGQDVALLRAKIVDATGNQVSTGAYNVSFSIKSGPGRVIGTANGDPQCHVANHLPSRPSYHGLVRAVVMSTLNSAGDPSLRDRILEIDAEAGIRTTILGSTSTPVKDPEPIVVGATCNGLTSASITIQTSNDPSVDGVLAVAAQMAGQPVHFD